MENISSMAKDTRIKSIYDLVIQIGYDPKTLAMVEEIVKKKNENIAALRKQLNMPATKDSLTKDIEENETQKAEMMNMIIEQVEHIKKMENEMEKLIKEK